MKIKCLALLLALVMVLLCGCGAETGNSAPMEKVEYSASMDAAAQEPMEEKPLADNAAGASVLPENRKWIVTVHMSAETEDLNTVLETLSQRIGELKGYVEDQRIHNGSIYSDRRYRYADLTIRIPAGDVDSFTADVEGMANVISSEQSRDDVTLSYVATESRVKALEAEEARLLELMEQAKNMSDLLEIEARLTDVRYELERNASQLRSYDNKIDYATIYLEIQEVHKLTPVAEQTTWERIAEGFTSSLEGLFEDLVNIFVWFIVSSPYLLVWAAVIFGVVLIVRNLRKRRAAKKAPKPQEPEKKPE